MDESEYDAPPGDMSNSSAWEDACDAVRSGDVDRLSDLLKSHPHLIRERDLQVGHTLLHVAASSGNTEIIRFLLARGE